MAWTKRLTIAAAALAAVVFTGSAQAATITINFGVIPYRWDPILYRRDAGPVDGVQFRWRERIIVNQIGAGDQSTLALGDVISLTNPNYGSGNIGSLTGDMTKSWTTAAGTFTETLTNVYNQPRDTRCDYISVGGHPYGTRRY